MASPAFGFAAGKKSSEWTPVLIKELRSKRTQEEFGKLLGVPKNTVWRWECGMVKPDRRNCEKMTELAGKERFMEDWNLVGSVTLLGDLDTADAEIAKLFEESVKQTADELRR